MRLYLELKLLEEPRVLVVQVLLPQDLGSVVKRGLLLSGITEGLHDLHRLDLGPEVVILEDMPCEEDMVAVDDLEEALDLGPLDELLLGHVLGHLLRWLLNSEDDAMRIRALLGWLWV